MTEQERRYQQLAFARHKYSNLTRSEGQKFRKSQQRDDDEMAITEQLAEKEKIEIELAALREEYGRICGERGGAHKVAKIVQAQEDEMAMFQQRMDKICTLRANEVAKCEQRAYLESQAQVKRDKDLALAKRKELLERDWTRKDNVHDKRDKATENELHKLMRLEKELERKIREKNEKRSNVAEHNENSVEKAAEKIMWPERPETNWNFLADESSTLSDLQYRDTSVLGHAGRARPTLTSARLHRTQSAATIRQQLEQLPVFNTEDPEFPAKIAEKVMDKLEEIRRSRMFKADHAETSRLFKDAAMNTSKAVPGSVHSTPAQNVQQLDQTSNYSGDTSYRSLPKDPMRPRKLKKVVQALENKIDAEPNASTSSSNSSEADLDQLLDKIESIKGAIEDEKKRSLEALRTQPKQLYPTLDSNLPNERNNQLSTIAEDTSSSSASVSSKSNGWKSPEVIVLDKAGPSTARKEAATSPPSSTISSVSSQEMSNRTELSSFLLKEAEKVTDKRQFWREVFELANVTFRDSAVEDVQGRHVEPPVTPGALSGSTRGSGGLRHSTPKVSDGDNVDTRGLQEEPNLTLIQSFSTDKEATS